MNKTIEVNIARACKRGNDHDDDENAINEDAKKKKIDDQVTKQVEDIADNFQSVFGQYSTIGCKYFSTEFYYSCTIHY